MHIRLYLLFLISFLSIGLCYSQRMPVSKARTNIIIPDTILIRTDRGNITASRFYVINAKNLIRIDYNANTEKRDTLFFEGLDKDNQRLYNHEVYLLQLRSKSIEHINDREALNYFQVGDSLSYFLSKLGTKKVHLSNTGYQLSFPDEVTEKPQVIEYKFGDNGILHGIERITKINSLPTNDVWTAFQLIEIKESLNDLEKAVNLLRSRCQKSSKAKRK